MNDPMGDMLTRIRNGQMRGKAAVETPASKLRGWVLDVLSDEGYIRGYEKKDGKDGHPAFSIEQQLSIEPEITPILSIDPDFTTMYAFVQWVGGKDFGYDVCRACGCSIMGWTDRRM